MNVVRLTLVCLTFLTVSACSTRVEVINPFPGHVANEGYRVGEIVASGVEVPDEFVRALRAHLEDELAANGLLAGRSAMRSPARRVDIVIGQFGMPVGKPGTPRGSLGSTDQISTHVSVHDSNGLFMATATVKSSDLIVSAESDGFTSSHARAIGRLLSGRG